MTTKPMVHLNGTSGEALSSGYAAAMTALGEALDKLGECAPNARDYYPLGDYAFNDATREHNTRVERVKATLKEVAEIWEHVEEVLDTKRAAMGRRAVK